MSFTGLAFSVMFVIFTAAHAMGQERQEELHLIGLGEQVVAGRLSISPAVADGPLAMLVASETSRLGCAVQEGYVADYLSTVRMIESSGNPNLVSSSGARDLYQFKPASRKATARYGVRYAAQYWGYTPEWLTVLASNNDEEVTLLEDRWQFLTMMHAIMRSGSDPYLRSAWCDGDQAAAIAVYERFHHTDPDDRTSARATALFGRIWPNT